MSSPGASFAARAGAAKKIVYPASPGVMIPVVGMWANESHPSRLRRHRRRMGTH